VKPDSFVIIKTLQGWAANRPPPEGLSLIAQFSFQRAAGVSAQNPNFLDETKIPRTESSLSTRPLRPCLDGGDSASTASGCQRFFRNSPIFEPRSKERGTQYDFDEFMQGFFCVFLCSLPGTYIGHILIGYPQHEDLCIPAALLRPMSAHSSRVLQDSHNQHTMSLNKLSGSAHCAVEHSRK
jgi:hypothetical protein